MTYSSLLLESEEKELGIDSIESIDESMTFDKALLEFNEEIDIIENEYKRIYYKALTENCLYNKSCEAILEGAFIDKCSRIIRAVIEFVKKVVKIIFNKKNKYIITAKAANKIANNILKSGSKELDIKYPFELNIHPEIDLVRSGGKEIINNLETVRNKIIDDINMNPDNLKIKDKNNRDNGIINAFNYVFKIIQSHGTFNERFEFNNSNPFDSVERYIRANVCVDIEKEISCKQYLEFVTNTFGNCSKNFSDLADTENGIIRAIEKIELDITRAKNMSNSDKQQIVYDSIFWIRAICTMYTKYVQIVCDTYEKSIINSIKNTNKIYKIINGKNPDSTVKESALIHGEPFNGDTLFANEDIRDFNRTEWLDLSLESFDYKIESIIRNSNTRIAIQEALILTDEYPNKITRLNLMREAEEITKMDKFMNIVKSLKALFDQFIAKMKDKFSRDMKYLLDNQDAIKKPIRFEQISSSGDIISGLYRVREPLAIERFDYEKFKNDLESPESFFTKHVLPNLNKPSNFSKNDLKWENNPEKQSITDYCKAYFGAPIKDAKFEFKAQEFDVNKENIIKFLTNHNWIAQINKDALNKLEIACKQYAQENKNNQLSYDNRATQPKEEQSENEFYYSELFGRYIHEIDVAMPEKSDDENHQNTENNKNATSEKDAAFKKFVDVYRKVLTSKITAIEFISSEFMSLMVKHAELNGAHKLNKKQNND